LDYTYNNLQATVQNYSASESAIKDVDMASEMTNFTKSQILEQAGTAMLAQANSSSQNILTLFK
jgi:flagellin